MSEDATIVEKVIQIPTRMENDDGEDTESIEEPRRKPKKPKVDKRTKGAHERTPAQIAAVEKMLEGRRKKVEEIRLAKAQKCAEKEEKKQARLQRTKSKVVYKEESSSEEEEQVVVVKKSRPKPRKKKKKIIVESSDSEEYEYVKVKKGRKPTIPKGQVDAEPPKPHSYGDDAQPQEKKPVGRPKKPISRYEYMRLLGF
jgi:hypothetical protein